MNKELRKQVWQKYDGHCAYCGCEIELKDMQVDHIIPRYRITPHSTELNSNVVDAKTHSIDKDNIDNLNPSCRQCNFYKSTRSLEQFRYDIKTLMERVKKPFIYRLADKYGMVQELEWDGLFYFERKR